MMNDKNDQFRKAIKKGFFTLPLPGVLIMKICLDQFQSSVIVQRFDGINFLRIRQRPNCSSDLKNFP